MDYAVYYTPDDPRAKSVDILRHAYDLLRESDRMRYHAKHRKGECEWVFQHMPHHSRIGHYEAAMAVHRDADAKRAEALDLMARAHQMIPQEGP